MSTSKTQRKPIAQKSNIANVATGESPGRKNSPKHIAIVKSDGPERHIENVFRALDRNNKGAVPIAHILEALSNQGILADDPRVKASVARLQRLKGSVTLRQFKEIFSENFSLIERAVKDQFIVPKFSKFKQDIEQIYDICKSDRGGVVADYIPQLARVGPENFAVAAATVDGQCASFGDFDAAYSVQSSCKPIMYAMALELHGEHYVHQHVGREPSGQSFNELALNPQGLPHNPMINAGAIMSSAMISPEKPLADRFDDVMCIWSKLSGGQNLRFNNPIYLSEKATADRNFALAYFMQEKGAFPENTNLLETLDFYFQACSIEINAEQMSIVAATLANAGVCPITNERVFSSDTVKNCLSLMYSCGMYDFSGEFAFTIGFPAKSGVSGVMMVVVPQVMGFAIWSPRLDELGNSVRGIKFCRKLVERFNFHNYDNMLNHETKTDPTKRDTQHRSHQVYQLINAASLGDINEISMLIAHGVNVNAADYDGRTPLHLAAAEGKVKTVEYLLTHKAIPHAKDRWGATPSDDAKRHNHHEAHKLLEDFEFTRS